MPEPEVCVADGNGTHHLRVLGRESHPLGTLLCSICE